MAKTPITVKELESKLTEKRALAKETHRNQNIGCGYGCNLYIYPSGKACYFAFVPKEDSQGHKNVYIGDYNKITLVKAREKAKSLIQKAKKNKREIDSSPLLSDYLDMWIEEKRNDFRNNKRVSNLKALKKHLSILFPYRLNEITQLLVYEKMQLVKTTKNNKHNAIAMLNQALRGAVIRGFIKTNPIADMLKGSESAFKLDKSKGFAWVKAELLNEKFFSKLENTVDICKVLYLYVTLTGARLDEARLLQWSWINYQTMQITIPADKTKANRVHIIPLTPILKGLLEKWDNLYRDPTSDFVFHAEKDPQKPIYKNLFQTAVTANCSKECTIHGLRKTIRTWMSENGISVLIAEMIISHDKRDQLMKIYDNNDYIKEGRTALIQWQEYIISQLPDSFKRLL